MYHQDPMIKIQLDKGALTPTRGHRWNGGLDLYATEDDFIQPNRRVTFNTGVHLEIPEGWVGLIRSRSGMMVNHGIVAGEGTIDAHYTGPIKVCLFNKGSINYQVKAGDKIAQLVIVPCMIPRLELVDHLEETDRGEGGFGSTGR